MTAARSPRWSSGQLAISGAAKSASRTSGLARLELALAIAAFLVLCVAVLTVAPVLVGPDGDAYRASIVAITDGHLLTLSTSQAHALAAQLASCPKSAGSCLSTGPVARSGPVIEQWVRLPDGRWISEKDPGYPFLAAPFQVMGVIRLAPLFYGALGWLGLYAGARRWLGPLGGAVAAGLFSSSSAAMFFAWQDFWPTFTDASLIAAGTGTLLWAALADDVPDRRRTWLGLLGFLAIDAAVLVRYTNIVVLGCAVVAVIVLALRRPGTVPSVARYVWFGSVALFGLGVGVLDEVAYGGPLESGYPPGEVSFSFHAIIPNLGYVPPHLIEAMPMLVLGLGGLASITLRRARLRNDDGEHGAPRHGATFLSPWPWAHPGSACGDCTSPTRGQRSPASARGRPRGSTLRP